MHVPFSRLPPQQRGRRLFDLMLLTLFGAAVLGALPPVAQSIVLYGGPRPVCDDFGGWLSVFGPLSHSLDWFKSWPPPPPDAKCFAKIGPTTQSLEIIVVLGDCLFAIGYGAGGALGARWLAEHAAHAPLRSLIWRFAAWSLLSAGAFDVIENLTILMVVLGAHSEALVVIARAASIPKCLGLAAGLFAAIGAALLWRVVPRR